ncbi:hypothetical protein GCM10011391_28480 [Pullulanibacillus camelliae]|uniref:HTH cro/C1-type domain-containing protein n=1 Tax=Pullulanibacillus camelliae TaxID=1707096 RepID=A0A8J3DVM3_9BACL|nr:helix-turn-helix transcriptional regulator [Pullulanibacillus camelliae]GGE47996.1 hypothetical protein GCM10011391_28480 [Pullulanibacillus camelliae]
MSLGKRLKREREKKNWSQKYVADKLGITNTVLSNYERDYRDPDTDTLKKISDLYDVSTDYLLGRTEESAPKESIIKEDNSNFFFFDKEGLTEEEQELLEQSYNLMRERARKRAEARKKKK